MASMLYKLGKWASNNSWKTIILVIILVAGLAFSAVTLGMNFSEDTSMPGTESEQAMKVLEEKYPDLNNGGKAYIIFKAEDGEMLSTEENNRVIQELLDEIATDEDIVSVATPDQLQNINPDKQIGYAVVTYDIPYDEVTEESKQHVMDSLDITREKGIQTELGGTIDFEPTEAGGAESIGIVIAYIILAVTFGSLVAAGLPILTAIISLLLGLLGIVILANYVEIQSVSITLAAMLGLAVGIDYGLFIISRFREEVKNGCSVKEAIAIANGTAGSAVVFAGTTVMIGLVALLVLGIPFIGAMGVASAIVVLCSVFVSLTITPAVLGILGHKMIPKNKNKKENKGTWGNIVTRYPVITIIVSVLLLVMIAIPFFHMEIGIPDAQSKTPDQTERKGYELLSEAYGEGFHSSLVVLLNPKEKVSNSVEDITKVVGKISELDNVSTVSQPYPDETGDVLLVSVTPEYGPNDLETKELVHDIRALSTEDIEILMTGTTAVNIDITEKIMDALPIFASIIVILAFVLLMIVFRSILIPLKAVLGFVLSIGAALGFSVFVVQDGNLQNLFGFTVATPLLFLLPILALGILFGLAMDYEVFLVSKMREVYSHTGNAREAVLEGVKSNAGVVAAAGLIMTSIFAGFILASDPTVKQMGLALAFGVLFDAFIVRLTLVPAIMILMGDTAWYLPKWLDRVLPNIDIEGESLSRELEE